jgi:hypothetical protein
MDCIKEYNVTNDKYPIINILNNIYVFELIYSLNPDLLQRLDKTLIDEDNMNLVCYMKNLSGLTLENFYLDVSIKKSNKDNQIQYKITNNNFNFDNIQFKEFIVTITELNDSHFTIKIEYSLDEDLYSRVIINILKKLIAKLFSNLETYLCKITI